jgi:uncharacterized protein YkwD
MLIKIACVLGKVVLVFGISLTALTIFFVGFLKGYVVGRNEQQNIDQKYLSQIVSSTSVPNTVSVPGTTKIVYITPAPRAKVTWGGPQLWEAVNKRRVELGVNPLQVKEEVCTIASIRLNQILELKKLDGHVGFTNMPNNRPDLKWIFDKYNLSEFLVGGASSPQDAVNLWENTLGHKELLSGGQYVWGCIYAQNGFGVAITAY